MLSFIETPFVTRSTGGTPHICMNLRPNRYNPSFRRSYHKPSNLPPTDNNPKPTLASNGNPPPTPPGNDTPPDRPERPDDHEPLPGIPKTNFHWPALRNRLMANPRLPLQLFVELTVGGVSKTIAEVQDRGTNFFNQFDQYLCNLSLELFGDAMLVWLLSPVAGAVSGLPKHAFQQGNFSGTQRVIGFVWKGLQFGVVGIGSSLVGQAATRGLVKVRGGDTDSLPSVLPNCFAWGGFLMMSSNTRYQLVNGFEQRVLERLLPPGLVNAGVTFAVRFGNCYVGGIQWLPWARFLGVQ